MNRFLLCSFALVLLYPTAIDLYLVGLPQIAQSLQASESQLHMAFSIYLAGMATTMLFAGRLADAIGRKPIAISGAVIFVLASIACGLAQDSATFLIARFAQGIGAGSCYVVAFAILRDTLDDTRRAKVLSMLNGVTCIMPVLAPVAGYLIMTRYPWTTLFTVMAVMGGLVLALSLGLLKESNPHLQSSAAKKTEENTAESTNSTAESFYQRYFISRLIITSLGVTTILTFVNVSPMLIMGTLNFSRGDYASIMALTALVSMLTSLATPLALSKLKQKTMIFMSQSLFICASVVLMTAYLQDLNTTLFLLGFTLVCAGFSCGFGVTMSQALSPFAKNAGLASSILGVAQVCTSALYIWLMGVLGVNALNMLMTILAIGGVISIALILLTPSQQLRYPNEEILGAS